MGRWFLSFLVTLLISLWLAAATLQMTILNRTMVEGWLQNSGLYQNLISAIPLEVPGAASGQSFVTAADIKQALADTFKPSFLQTQTESILNSTYDWMEGKTPAITFSIPVNQKKAEFIANMAKVIKTKVAALPPCASAIAPSTNQPTCLPKGVSAADFADQLSHLTDGQGQDLLSKPITQKDLGNVQSPLAGWITAIVPQVGWTVIVMPILALLAAAGFVLLNDDMLKGLATIGRRIFFHGLVVAVIGGLLWYFGQSFSLDSFIPTGEGSEVGQSIAKNLAEPLVHVVAPGIGQVLALLAGAVAIVGAAAWLAGHILKRKRDDQNRPEPPKPAEPQPPTNEMPTPTIPTSVT